MSFDLLSVLNVLTLIGAMCAAFVAVQANRMLD